MWTVKFRVFKLDWENAGEPEIKLPTSVGSLRKQESSRKTSTSALLTTPKPLTVWIMTNWKILQEMELPDHLTCLLRNLYAGQEATVRTGHGTTDWFQIGKGVHQGCILSPCLFNLYAEYIMWNARLDEAQAGIKIAGRSINNLRFADDTTLMAESEEELKSQKERSFWPLKINVQVFLANILLIMRLTVSRSDNLSSNAYLFWLIHLQEVFWHYCCFLGRLPWDKTSLNSQ